jgi:hypothetical protein
MNVLKARLEESNLTNRIFGSLTRMSLKTQFVRKSRGLKQTWSNHFNQHVMINFWIFFKYLYCFFSDSFFQLPGLGGLGSISSTFYEKLFWAQILKVQKKDLQLDCLFCTLMICVLMECWWNWPLFTGN